VDVSGDAKLSLSLDTTSVILTYSISTLDPSVDKVWFGIFHVEEKNSRYYRRFQYLRDTTGTKTMNVMKTPGTYEARLFAHGSAEVICRSNTVTIPAETKTL